MNLLAKFVHGSHLYGLNTPNSDMDYKAIYIPSKADYLLCRVQHSINMSSNITNEKNSSSDVDYEVYSLNKFIQMAYEGEMIAFDMLFAPDDMVTYYGIATGEPIRHDNYVELRDNPVYMLREFYRRHFVKKDMRAYLSYCRKQAAKYGVKGSRLADVKAVHTAVTNHMASVDVLNTAQWRLDDIKDILPALEHCYPADDFYHVLGKRHQWTIKIDEFIERLESEIRVYGARAKLAEQNEGVDWKAVSHAFRAGYQLIELYQSGIMTLPLPEPQRSLILSIKLGEVDWSDAKVMLEKLIDDVEVAASKCDIKETPDDTIDAMTLQLIENAHRSMVTLPASPYA